MATRWKIRTTRRSDTKTLLLGLVAMTSLTVIALLVIRIEGEQTRQTIREVAQTTNVDVNRVAKASIDEMSQLAETATRNAVRAGVNEAALVATTLPGKMWGSLLPDNAGDLKRSLQKSANVKQVEGSPETKETAELKETAEQAEEIIADAFRLGRKMTAAVNDAAQRTLKSTTDNE